MANVNVRIDSIVKTEAETIFLELGLTPSTAINLFYKQVIRTGSIPFKIQLEKPNRKTMRAIKEAERIEKYPNKKKVCNSVEELIDELNK